MINETALDKEYHFTTIENLMSMMESDTINLQNTESGERGGYHLSLTRQRTNQIGYGYDNFGFKGVTKCYARIEFNGQKLNTLRNVSVRPYDYNCNMTIDDLGGDDTFLGMNQKQILNKSIEDAKAIGGDTYNNLFNTKKRGSIYHQIGVESEDSLTLPYDTIVDAIDYINRIDVYLGNKFDNQQTIAQLKQHMKEYPDWAEKIFIYNKNKFFNYQTNNTISLNEHEDFAAKSEFKLTPYSFTEYSHVVDEELTEILDMLGDDINEGICFTKKDIKYNIDLSSFTPQKSLNEKIWVNNKLNSKVRMRLLDIADDFVKEMKVSWVKPTDIILTGSLANYNWSKYSDFDLHILIDFKKVDSRVDFVRDYFDSKKNLWNESHDKLKIYGFPVEVYVQDVNDEHNASGIYSLEKNKWIIEPEKNNIRALKGNKVSIKNKTISLMKEIDKLSDNCKKENDSYKIEKIADKANNLYKKIKAMRSDALKHNGEMATGNIIYKLLRRNEYLGKLYDLKLKTYDKINSIK